MNKDLQKYLSSLCEISKAQLSKELSFNESKKKYLILDPNIIKPLEKICGAIWLKYIHFFKLKKSMSY